MENPIKMDDLGVPLFLKPPPRSFWDLKISTKTPPCNACDATEANCVATAFGRPWAKRGFGPVVVVCFPLPLLGGWGNLPNWIGKIRLGHGW